MGVTCGPLIPVAGALEEDVCWHRTGNGGTKGEGALGMDLCKRRCLQCERGVVHSGKSFKPCNCIGIRTTPPCKGSIRPTC